LSAATWKESVCPASLAGPAERFVAHPRTVCGPASSATVWSAPFAKLGVSLTAVTVTVTVAALDSRVLSFAL
jgi:hypothetical protein